MSSVWILVVFWHPLTWGYENSPPPIEHQWFETQAECLVARDYHRQEIGKGLSECYTADDAKIDWLP